MTDLLFPTWARISAQRVDAVSNTASARSIFTGAIRTVGRGGDRFRWGITTSNASDRETAPTRRALQALRAKARGQANRIWFAPPHVQRGSFPSQELLPNNTFENGVTGWGAYSAVNTSVTTADRSLRATRNIGTSYNYIKQSSSVTLSQYAPYVARAMIIPGRQSNTPQYELFVGSTLGAGDVADVISSTTVERPLMAASGVSPSTVGYYGVGDNGYVASGALAGDYFSTSYTSLSRCFQIDNGQNLLTYSDQFDNSAWTTTAASVGANSSTAPDGTITADALMETAVTSPHSIVQVTSGLPSSAMDYTIVVAVKAAGRNIVLLEMVEGLTTTSCYQSFDVSTGTLGAHALTGAGWSNRRAYIKNLGNDWYLCTVVGRKTSAATSISTFIYCEQSDGVVSYLGDVTKGLLLWRATLAQSGVPVRQVQTTSAATSGTLQSGNSLHAKGLPVSTNGLLLPGDLVQIGNQLNMVTASLDSDAAGFGYLQCANPWRTSPVDSAPVIVNTPMARCVLADNVGGWSDQPGIFSDFEFVLEEALDE